MTVLCPSASPGKGMRQPPGPASRFLPGVGARFSAAPWVCLLAWWLGVCSEVFASNTTGVGGSEKAGEAMGGRGEGGPSRAHAPRAEHTLRSPGARGRRGRAHSDLPSTPGPSAKLWELRVPMTKGHSTMSNSHDLPFVLYKPSASSSLLSIMISLVDDLNQYFPLKRFVCPFTTALTKVYKCYCEMAQEGRECQVRVCMCRRSSREMPRPAVRAFCLQACPGTAVCKQRPA